MRFAVERRAVGYDATGEKVPNDRLPMAKYDRFQASVQVRRVDAGMQTAQATLHRKATYAPRGGRITFIDDNQLGQLVRIQGHWGLQEVQTVRIVTYCVPVCPKSREYYALRGRRSLCWWRAAQACNAACCTRSSISCRSRDSHLAYERSSWTALRQTSVNSRSVIIVISFGGSIGS